MSTAWKTARYRIKEAQEKQKFQHDKKAKDPRVFEGDRVLVYSPTERSGKAYKFACPFKGPYRIMKMLPSGAATVTDCVTYRTNHQGCFKSPETLS